MVLAEGFAILAVKEEELVLDGVQLTAAILNASKAIDNFFMNGFNEQYLLNSGITTLVLKNVKIQQL